MYTIYRWCTNCEHTRKYYYILRQERPYNCDMSHVYTIVIIICARIGFGLLVSSLHTARRTWCVPGGFFFSWVFTRFFSATFSCTRRTHAYTCVHSSFLLLRGSVAAIFNDTCVLILHKYIHMLSRRTVLSCIPWPGYTPILYIYSNIYVFRTCTPRYYTHIRRRFQYFFPPVQREMFKTRCRDVYYNNVSYTRRWTS